MIAPPTVIQCAYLDDSCEEDDEDDCSSLSSSIYDDLEDDNVMYNDQFEYQDPECAY